MEHFAGLDVSLERTSVRAVDKKTKIVRKENVVSVPHRLLALFSQLGGDVTRIGLQAGPLSQ